MDDDARWIASALVRIAQLDAPAAHQRRLVLHDGALERLGELGRRDIGHRRVVRLDGRSDQLTDAGAVARRHELYGCVGHEIELEFELTADVFALLVGDAVPFVDGDQQRPAALQRKPQHARILFADAVVGIDHEDDDMGGVDGLQGLGDARLLNHIRNLAATAHARGVDQGELAAVARERHEDAVACGARHLARDHPLLTDEPVDERRLTDVRAADDSDADASIGHGVAIDDLGRVPSFEHQIHEVTTAVAVRRGDRMWLTEAERMEIRTSGRRIEPLGLVDREEHGLAGTTQLARHKVILGGETSARIGKEHEHIGFGDGTLGLQAHRLLDARGLLDEATGVDDDIGDRPEAAVAVLAIARDARHVRDQGVPGPGQAVEERGLADIRPPDQHHHRQHRRHRPIRWGERVQRRGRKALTRPSSSCTTSRSPATCGALVTRPPALLRAAKAPLVASNQCK